MPLFSFVYFLNLVSDLSKASVYVGYNHNDLLNGTCGYIGDAVAQQTSVDQRIEISCQRQGRYVGIKGQGGITTLQLCDVQAFEFEDYNCI